MCTVKKEGSMSQVSQKEGSSLNENYAINLLDAIDLAHESLDKIRVVSMAVGKYFDPATPDKTLLEYHYNETATLMAILFDYIHTGIKELDEVRQIVDTADAQLQ